jgi:hypothetical protein
VAEDFDILWLEGELSADQALKEPGRTKALPAAEALNSENFGDHLLVDPRRFIGKHVAVCMGLEGVEKEKKRFAPAFEHPVRCGASLAAGSPTADLVAVKAF